ncbi:glycosyltransferase [Humibacter ginsengiterrae]
MKFSLLLPVYMKDDPTHFERAFKSAVEDQTRRPDEAVIVQDGPVPDSLARAIRTVLVNSSVRARLISLDSNVGLAKALTEGLAACSFDVVARMDADDIALPHRFETQLSIIEKGYDLVGSGMFEFDASGAILGVRRPPTDDDAIRKAARLHDPFNHPTVVYRRSAVLRAGGYRDLPLMEDYWLFARMIQSGARMTNVADPLVMYRVDAGAYARRGGSQLFRSEWRLQRALLADGFVSRGLFARNILVRGAYRFIPTPIRRALYRKALVLRHVPEMR